jgi:hypothetical protein
MATCTAQTTQIDISPYYQIALSTAGGKQRSDFYAIYISFPRSFIGIRDSARSVNGHHWLNHRCKTGAGVVCAEFHTLDDSSMIRPSHG